MSDDTDSGSRVTPVPGWARQDSVLLAVLLILSLLLYSPLAWRLAQGVYLNYYNLAFDFDPIRTVDALTTTPPDFLNVKHPLFVLLRPLAWPLLWLGCTGREAAALLLSGFGAVTVALCFVFLRQARIERPIASALTVLFIVSGAQIFTAIIAETYGVASFTIVLTWVIAQARLRDPSRFRILRYVAGVATFGTTLTNVMQTAIAEFVVAWRHLRFSRAFRPCILFGVILGGVIAVLATAVWYHDLLDELRDPVLALKHIFWQQTKGPVTGPGQVLLTFFTYSFVSPGYSWLMLPEGINMRDFRDYIYPPAGFITAPLWLVFCAVGTVAGLMHRRYRVIAAAIAVALLCNLLFHMRFQFRGSLYLYAAHMHFLVFALACGLAPWLRCARWPGKAYLAVVVLLAVMIGANNLPVASVFAESFDTVDLSCVAPCTDKVGQ